VPETPSAKYGFSFSAACSVGWQIEKKGRFRALQTAVGMVPDQYARLGIGAMFSRLMFIRKQPSPGMPAWLIPSRDGFRL
jgi:hypothetical protein